MLMETASNDAATSIGADGGRTDGSVEETTWNCSVIER
jgi:hypothetical protein